MPCGLLAVAAAPAQEFHIEGTLSYTAFTTNGATRVSMSRQFTLEVAQGRWAMHSVPLTAKFSPGERWQETAWDGTNLYSLRVSSPRSGTSFLSSGSVWQETVPFPGTDLTAPVWFAYIKAASQQAPGKFKPLWFTDQATFYSPKVGVQALIQTNAAAPNLPQQAWFINSGKEVVRFFGKELSLQDHPHAYTNAIYTASNFVAVGQWSVPKSFMLDAYGPDERGVLYRYLRFAGTASVISPEMARTQFVPPITVGTYVDDFRLPVGKTRLKFKLEGDDDLPPHLEYVITNSWLTSTNEPRFRDAILQGQSKTGRMLRF